MNANTRKVHRTVVGFGLACAVAAALPCVAGDAAPVMDPVTVQAKSVPPDTGKKPGKSAPAEENIGFFSGIAIGAVPAAPSARWRGVSPEHCWVSTTTSRRC